MGSGWGRAVDVKEEVGRRGVGTMCCIRENEQGTRTKRGTDARQQVQLGWERMTAVPHPHCEPMATLAVCVDIPPPLEAGAVNIDTN